MKLVIWIFVILLIVGFSIPKEDRLSTKITKIIEKQKERNELYDKILKGENNGR